MSDVSVLPGWTDRPAKDIFVGQRIMYVLPSRIPGTIDRCAYGVIADIRVGSVSIQLDDRVFRDVPFRFERQEDNIWRRYPSSKAYLAFKEAPNDPVEG